MENNTQYILSLSYGKDSMACLFALEELGWPLDRIITAEVWATDTIHSDLPPMLEFKEKADRIIKERWGIEVEHICAERNGEKLTYEKLFYHVPERRKKAAVQSPEREREREREIPGREPPGISHSQNAVVQRKPQNACAAVSLTQSADGARSSSTGAIYGFPYIAGPWGGGWCKGLKNQLFHGAPRTGRGDKYCAVPGHRG